LGFQEHNIKISDGFPITRERVSEHVHLVHNAITILITLYSVVCINIYGIAAS